MKETLFTPEITSRLGVQFSTLKLVEISGGNWLPNKRIYSTETRESVDGRQKIYKKVYSVNEDGLVGITTESFSEPSTFLESLRDFLTSKVSSFFNPEPMGLNGEVIDEVNGPVLRYFQHNGMTLMGDSLKNVRPEGFRKYG